MSPGFLTPGPIRFSDSVAPLRIPVTYLGFDPRRPSMTDARHDMFAAPPLTLRNPRRRCGMVGPTHTMQPALDKGNAA